MNVRLLLTAAVSGLLFGAGLVISDMASPVRVLAFLHLGPQWDATLGWVMASALAISVPGFAWLRSRGRPLFAGSFSNPPTQGLDRPLMIGAALFGLGWGLAGYCPGPALVNAMLGLPAGLWFVAAMLGGAGLARLLPGRSA